MIFIVVTLCFVDETLKVLKEAARVLKGNGLVILGVMLKGCPWASFHEKKGMEGNVFYKIDEFHTMNNFKSILKNVGLQISGVTSTTLQPPTEEPLHFEVSREGYYKETGFVAIKTQKRNKGG